MLISIPSMFGQKGEKWHEEAVCRCRIAVIGGISVERLAADVTPKYLVNHKGDWICVDADSVQAHLNHGDTTDWIVCGSR